MKSKTIKKLTKAEASRIFKSLIGTSSGVGEVTENIEFAIRQGQIVYCIELVDLWPFGVKVQMTAFIGETKIIDKLLFDRESHLPWTEEDDRAKLRERIDRALDKSKDY
ncbi:hypothetical protein PAT3040_04120 [Paenibacillus agaridevorans]|uniref:Uncharacterized protein n=1 Tax=Paenibacillus agaridevorans TaxID=171404 RepID=A0A2R5F193_9BACL|nr:hypothetical protein [Paenibacillus agaridevorans]GBG09474.1 hypothetical protein PAT3040_04120 [Paenibacillus agaridevorans]